VEFTNVVVLLVPFQVTTELGMKPVPFTVKVNAGPPAVALDGDKLPGDGAGLLTARLMAFDGPPPGVGLKTVIGKEPTV
jgi:hypothetical protein